jgi:hypothetical protein
VKGIRSRCPAGTYGNRLGLSSPACSGLCPVGHYCPEGSINGTFHRCPAGRYGSSEGETDSSCSGECAPGYHCYEGSVSLKQLQCAIIKEEVIRDHSEWRNLNAQNGSVLSSHSELLNRRNVYLNSFPMILITNPLTNHVKYEIVEGNNVYCPLGTSIPLTVLPGYYSKGFNSTTRDSQDICPKGSYCVNGKKYACPAGSYGDHIGLYNETCNGKCIKGFYCPSGSTSSRQFPCPIGKNSFLLESFCLICFFVSFFHSKVDMVDKKD